MQYRTDLEVSNAITGLCSCILACPCWEYGSQGHLIEALDDNYRRADVMLISYVGYCNISNEKHGVNDALWSVKVMQME